MNGSRPASSPSGSASPGTPRARVDRLERLADRIAARLDELQAERSGWVGAGTVAAHLSVDVGFVYDHADDLGAIRLGGGPKARLRFRLHRVDEALEAMAPCPTVRGSEVARTGVVEAKRRRKQLPLSGTGVPLIPVRGREAEP